MTQLGQLTPPGPRDIPNHMTSCSACKSGGRRRKKGNIQSYSTWLPHDGAWLSWRWLSTCPSLGSGEQIPCLAWLAPAAFALPIKVSLSQSMSFILLFHPTEWSEQAALWCLFWSPTMLGFCGMQEGIWRGENNKMISRYH